MKSAIGVCMVGCVVCLVLAWPWAHHKKVAPLPPAPPSMPFVADFDPTSRELAKYEAEIVDIHDNYPWLKDWAIPEIDLINKIEVGDDKDLDDDIDSLRSGMRGLENMELNDTI